MKTYHILYLSAFSCVAMSMGCSSIPAPVTTVWQQIGFPQAIERLADQNLNKRGNRPEAERKPKLKRLADPANLEADAPEVLKAAGEIKKQEDLAPQKIKALKYLGKVGCGCYNKKNADMVENALLEALEDCTPEVRKAALEAVCSAAGSCGCSTDECNGSACCTKKILKKIEEMAYKQDKNGCFVEPDASIRNIAANALNVCPPLPPEEVKKEDPMETPDVTETTMLLMNYDANQREQSSRASYTSEPAPQSTDSKLIDSTVFDVVTESNTFSLEFAKPYKLPEGTIVQVSAADSQFECVVIQSAVGSVLLESPGTEVLENVAKNDSIQIAVLNR